MDFTRHLSHDLFNPREAAVDPISPPPEDREPHWLVYSVLSTILVIFLGWALIQSMPPAQPISQPPALPPNVKN